MEKDYTPQWLKENFNRGYKPTTIYHDFDKSLFTYINPSSDVSFKAPITKSFVLEGLPGAGKTTLLGRFKKRADIHTIPQILPSEPIDDQAMGAGFYFNSEELKTKEFIGSTKKTCLFDRYYVSVLAFYWAYDKIHNTHTYKRALDWYRRALSKRTIWQPREVFFIDVDPELSIKRKNRMSNSSAENLWENTRFLKYFGEYYIYFYKEIEPRTKVSYISGSLPLDKIEKMILEVIYE